MYLINSFGRVFELDDESKINAYKKNKDIREATSEEISAYMQHQIERNQPVVGANSVYYQTVPGSPDGYGMSRDHLKRELYKNGIHLNENYQGQKVGLLYNYPYSLASMRTDVKIIYTMFESDKIPDDWPEYLELADEVLVPSKFCQDVFAKAGITSTVVPLGYNDKVFTPQDRDPRREQPFTFLQYDAWGVRKGFLEIFKAFNEEFTDDDNVRLVLKTKQNSMGVPIIPAMYPKVDIIYGMMTEIELLHLLEQADCFVFPSRGEGFGITPLEAMATGLPAIIPNAHGISEYFETSCMIEVAVEGPSPAMYNRFNGQDVGSMVTVSVEDLRLRMRQAYERPAVIRELGLKAQEYVKAYTYEKTAANLATIIKKWEAASVTRKADSKYLEVETV